MKQNIVSCYKGPDQWLKKQKALLNDDKKNVPKHFSKKYSKQLSVVWNNKKKKLEKTLKGRNDRKG